MNRPELTAVCVLAIAMISSASVFGQCPEPTACLSAGHTVVDTSAWAFSEDIDITSKQTVTYSSALPWTPVLAGCSGQPTIVSSVPFHLIVRGLVSVSSNPAPTAPAGVRYDIQIAVGSSPTDPNPRIASWELRRLHGKYPQSDTVGGMVQNLPAGSYYLWIQVRLLDNGGIANASATFDARWLTAQGVPNNNPSGRVVTGSDLSVTTAWAPIGPSLQVSNPVVSDLALGSALQFVSGTPGERVLVGFSVDGQSSGSRYGHIMIPPTMPDGVNVFDHWKNVSVPAGSHTLQLYMRTSSGTATVRNPTLEYTAIPANSASPMVDFLNTTTVHVTEAGSTAPTIHQGIAYPNFLVPGVDVNCGHPTYLGEIQVPAVSGQPDRFFEGFVQLLGNSAGSTAADILIESLKWGADGSFENAFDNGATGFQVTPTESGVYFYGDAYKNGLDGGGATIRLWIRPIICYGVGSGSFDVGKRWLSIKVTPREACAR